MNKGTLVNSQSEQGRVPWGRPLCMLIKKKKVAKQAINFEEQIQHGVKLTLPGYTSWLLPTI